MPLSQTIKTKLETAQTIALFWHENIDGDALGSMYGLWLQLEKLGKKIWYFTPDQPSPLFSFLDISTLQTTFDYGKYDLIVLLDMNHPLRMKKFYKDHEEYFDQAETIIIDHHLPEPIPALSHATIFADHTAIAACELVYELTTARRKEKNLMDERIATFLYMGMTSDSGNFRHDEAYQTTRLMENALWAIKQGANKQAVINNLFRNKSYEDLAFMQHILARMQKQEDICYSRYTKAELADSWLHRDSADYALYLMVDVRTAQLIILGKETDEGIRISFRGKGKYNTRELAAHFGGGGHFNASGCTIPSSGNMQQDMEVFIKQIQTILPTVTTPIAQS